MKRISIAGLLGFCVALLGLSAMVGWVFHYSTLINIYPGQINMVFNTAVCFAMAGTTLVLINLFPSLTQKLTLAVGITIGLMAGITLSEYVFHYSSGLDQLFAQHWQLDYNPNPGRMAANTAMGFLLTSISFILFSAGKNRLLAACTKLSIFGVGLLGLSALLGYLLGFEFLYSWYSYTQMAIHTCVGFSILGVSLWLSWKNANHQPHLETDRDDKKILLYNTITLFCIASLAGILGFVVSVKQDEATIKQFLQESLEEKVNLLEDVINQSVLEMKSIESNNVLRNSIINSSVKSTNELQEISQFLLSTTFSAIQINDQQNHTIYRSGNLTANPSIMIPIFTPPFKAALLWNNTLTLQLVDAVKQNNIIRYVKLEWPLDTFNRIFTSKDPDKNQEFSFCYLGMRDTVKCITPNHPNQAITQTLNTRTMGQLTELVSANRTGTITDTDFQNRHTFLAYHPLPQLKAGLLIKSDLAQMYLPLHKQLLKVLPIFLLAICFGALFLYRRILPLVHKVISSRKEAMTTSIRLKTIMNHIAEGIIIINEKGTIEDVNPKISSMFGYTTEECIGSNVRRLIPQEDINSDENGMLIYNTNGENRLIGKSNVEVIGLRKNNEYFPLELAITEMWLEHNRYFVGIMRDISERKAQQEKLLESEARFRMAFDTSAIGMAIIALNGDFIRVNPALCHILGYREDELLQLSFKNITYPADLEASIELHHKLLSESQTNYEVQKRYVHKSGHAVWAQLNLSLMHNSAGQQLYIMAQIQDITAQKKAEEQLNFQANHDALTGLANRNELETRMTQILDYSRDRKKRFAVFFLDLDKFKQVNDTYGHDAGDRLLITIAERLQSHVRKSDVVARLGGDEFVLILEELTNYEEAAVFAERVLSLLLKPITIKGHQLFISTSIGISFYPDDGADAETLLSNADKALYQSKEHGRNNYQFCQAEISTQVKDKMAFESELEKALTNDEFQLYYLPQVDAKRQQVTGVEALLRWKSKQYGLVTPDHIIPLAEESGLIIPLSEWIVRTACHQVKIWQTNKIPGLRLAANISSRQFLNTQLIPSILDGLDKSGFDPSSFVVEINETLIMQDPTLTLEIIQELKNSNIKVTIDNFGTGYSSLSYLQDFMVDAIKIDRSLVQLSDADSKRAKLVEAIISLATHLGIQVIAEGVETVQQYEFLINAGCYDMQGYYICKPMGADQLGEFLREFGARTLPA